MKEYFDYLDSLEFQSSIDYSKIEILIKNCLKNYGHEIDYEWDWNEFYSMKN